MWQIKNQEYDLKSKALASIVNQRLLEIAAKSKGIASADALLEQMMDRNATPPTDSEVEAYYLAQKSQINEWKSRPDPVRILGSADAPVTIVEFGDFQCPYCQAVQPTLKAVMEKYRGKVRLGFRDFPLRQIHPQAQQSAEAAHCAGDQGKFWEYHDLLYNNQSRLDLNGLKESAATAVNQDGGRKTHGILSHKGQSNAKGMSGSAFQREPNSSRAIKFVVSEGIPETTIFYDPAIGSYSFSTASLCQHR